MDPYNGETPEEVLKFILESYATGIEGERVISSKDFPSIINIFSRVFEFKEKIPPRPISISEMPPVTVEMMQAAGERIKSGEQLKRMKEVGIYSALRKR